MKRIMVVDDVTTNLICAAEILKDDYLVIKVKSAKAALDSMNEDKPDLVLVDICMPEMDGFQLYDKMQKNPCSAEIPVIFCTAENSKAVMEKGSRLGAGCIRKPYSTENLREAVKKVFEKQ